MLVKSHLKEHRGPSLTGRTNRTRSRTTRRLHLGLGLTAEVRSMGPNYDSLKVNPKRSIFH